MNELAIVIPSRKRARRVLKAARLFKSPYVCVAESEFQDYSSAGCKNLVSHPDDISGIGKIRNWILNHFDEAVVVMVDDDVSGLWCNVAETGKLIDNPNQITAIVSNAANIAADLGAHIFGFSQTWDVRKYSPLKPFSLCTWLGGVIGFVGRSESIRYSSHPLRVDIDYCLQSLLHHRIVWQDNRFGFIQNRFSGAGGNSLNRSRAQDELEVNYLRKKWGKYIEFSPLRSSNLRIKINVKRHADLVLT